MKEPLNLNRKKTRFLWPLLGFIVLILILSGCQTFGGMLYPGIKWEYSSPYKIGKGEPYGIVEFFNITSFGFFMKGLKQGPESPDQNVILMSTSGSPEWKLAGKTDVPQVPVTLSARDRSLADNFSFCRVALPPGEYRFKLAGFNPYGFTWYRGGLWSGKIVAEKIYISNTASYQDTVKVQANRMTVVRIHLGRMHEMPVACIYKAGTTLPIPANPKKVYADPNSINELFELLQEEDWGLRWYAARRLGELGDRRAIEPLKEALVKEKHTDDRKAMEGALKGLQ